MLGEPGRRRVFIVLIAFLLMMLTIGCSCGQVVQEWLNQLVQDIARAVENWVRDQIARLIANLQQQIADWWNGLWQGAGQAWDDLWDGLGQTWRDFWASILPPAPTIDQPADGLVAGGMTLDVSGTATANGTVTLYRNNVAQRTVQSDAGGHWSAAAMELTAGDNVWTAKVKVKVFPSGPSNAVKVSWAGAAPGSVPAMTPAIGADLDPAAWMTELALELLAEDGNVFYEEQRAAYTAALRTGLMASQEDVGTHRFINVDGPLSFDQHVLALAVPMEATREAVLEALAKAVEGAILDKAVRKTIMEELSSSLELLDLTWTVEAGATSYSFRYVYVELSRTTLIKYFGTDAFAKFRFRLGAELITGLAVGVPTAILADAIERGFGFWGRADADAQVQHYYDLAIRAWNHRDLAGATLRWDDPLNNAFDGDMGYRFGSNQEWAMFYLGRAIFYLQGVSDPYYTIPDYLPEAKFYALLVRQGVSALATRYIEKQLAPVLGKVAGGAQPLTQLFRAKEIMEWIAGLTETVDAWEVNNLHRPYFGDFTAGRAFDYPMPPARRDLGATNPRAGYPFRGPADILLHDSLGDWPLYPQERGQTPRPAFSADALLEAKAEEFAMGDWTHRNWREITRDIARHATGYIHPGLFGQSDKRVPEGAMIADNPYVIREVYSYEITDRRPGAWWDAEIGTRFRLVLLDGSVITGQVVERPLAQPADYRYSNTQVLVEDTAWLYIIALDHLNQLAGADNLGAYAYLNLIARAGDEKHLYAVFDEKGGNPREITMGSDLSVYFVGMTGNASDRYEMPERDGAAAIAADRLEVGALATRYLLGTFSAEAPAYRPPEPIVCPANAVCAALGSPATLHLRDRDGRHVGPNASGGVDLQIAGSRYFTGTASGQQFIVVPDANLGAGYAIRVEGTGSGTFDLDLFYGDVRRERAYRQAYADVPLGAGTVAEVTLAGAEQPPLRLDAAGDGAFERALAPSRTMDVAIYDPGRRQPPWALLLAGGVLLIAAAALLILGVQRRRGRTGPTPPSGSPGLAGQPGATCPRCGAGARPGARFCLTCGAALAQAPAPPVAPPPSVAPPAACPQCGAIVPRSGARFCQKCGRPLF